MNRPTLYHCVRLSFFGGIVATALSGCPRPPTVTVSAAAPSDVGPHHAGAWQALESAASDLDPAVRARALNLLVRHSAQPGGGDWTPRGLWDPSPWVQRAVIDALAARTGDPVAVTHLESVARRVGLDTYTRCGAALKLGRAGRQDVLPDVQKAEKDAGEAWRAAPCALAASALGDADASDRLAGILREGDLPYDIAFIDNLGRSNLPGLIPALAEAADLVEEPLRPAIGAALLQLGSPRGEALLREGLTAAHPQPQLEALDYLADIALPDATNAIRRAASSARGEASTYAQLILLGRGLGGLTIAEEAAGSDDREERAWSMRFVGEAVVHARTIEPDRRLERTALRLLEGGAGDLDDPVREAAARAMATLPAPQVGSHLEGLLADDNPRVRVEAAGALLAAAPR